QFKKGALSGYTSLADFLDQEYQDRVFTKEYLKGLVDKYREQYSNFWPTPHRPNEGITGTNWKAIDARLSYALSGYTSLPDFLDKEYPQRIEGKIKKVTKESLKELI